MFGVVHYAFLVNAILIGICSLFILQRYMRERNILTMIFFFFLIYYVVIGLSFFLRGIYMIESPEEVLLFKVTLSGPMVLSLFLAFFTVIPLAQEKQDSSMGTLLKVVLLLFTILSAVVLVIIGISGVSETYTADFLAHYNLDPYSPNFTLYLASVLTVGIFDALMLLLIAIREQESFYKLKAFMLFLGWILIVVAQVLFLIPETALLNPILSITGILLLTAAVLRQPK